MTELEVAMGMIVDVFARYSGVEGAKQSLTKGELKALMEKELPGFLQVRGCALGYGMGLDGVGAGGPRPGGRTGQDGTGRGGGWGQGLLGPGRTVGEEKAGHRRQKGRKGSGPNCSKVGGWGRAAVRGGRLQLAEEWLCCPRGLGIPEQKGEVARSVLETELEPQITSGQDSFSEGAPCGREWEVAAGLRAQEWNPGPSLRLGPLARSLSKPAGHRHPCSSCWPPIPHSQVTCCLVLVGLTGIGREEVLSRHPSAQSLWPRVSEDLPSASPTLFPPSPFSPPPWVPAKLHLPVL